MEVETSDGHTIRWERKNSPKYVVNGELFDRLSRGGQPEQLQQALRLPKVDAGEGTSFDIHFGNQKSPIFLLDSPQSAAAKFFASSSDAIHLVEMQRRHKERLADKHREKTRLEGESKQLTAEREALQPTMQIDHRLKALEQRYLELGQLKDRLVLFERDAKDAGGPVNRRAPFQRAVGRFRDPSVAAGADCHRTDDYAHRIPGTRCPRADFHGSQNQSIGKFATAAAAGGRHILGASSRQPGRPR